MTEERLLLLEFCLMSGQSCFFLHWRCFWQRLRNRLRFHGWWKKKNKSFQWRDLRLNAAEIMVNTIQWILSQIKYSWPNSDDVNNDKIKMQHFFKLEYQKNFSKNLIVFSKKQNKTYNCHKVLGWALWIVAVTKFTV